MYDLIGDIHGHAEELELLLLKLGYTLAEGVWRHDTRKVIFLGDYIDRGPHQRKSVQIVRSMVESGHALAIMGNHEFNAIGYATEKSNQEALRPHTSNNRKQHERFLEEFPLGSPEHKDVIAWFKKLPLYIELPQFRAVHACYDHRQLKIIETHLGPDYLLHDKALVEAFTKNSELYEAIEVTLKGIEADLPEGVSYPDKEGIIRHNVRCNWWNPACKTFKDVALISDESMRARLSDSELPVGIIPKYDNKKPVFFGHYWYESAAPHRLSDYAACLDYSVANKEITIGKLVAYRLHEEAVLKDSNFVYVDSIYSSAH